MTFDEWLMSEVRVGNLEPPSKDTEDYMRISWEAALKAQTEPVVKVPCSDWVICERHSIANKALFNIARGSAGAGADFIGRSPKKLREIAINAISEMLEVGSD